VTVKPGNTLRFACECVSARGGYSDPWAAVAQKRLLLDGTKERLLNSVAREPRTIAQLAKGLCLSQPTVHAHVNEMLASELLRESHEPEKQYAAERYYEPNFPVVRTEERAEFDLVCQTVADRIAKLFESNVSHLKSAFDRSGLVERGWTFDDLAQYCYAGAQRAAREMLEGRGVLRPRKHHRNGAAWLFWAEEEPNGGAGTGPRPRTRRRA